MHTRLPQQGQKIKPSVFLAATVFFFFLSLSAADSIGFVPYYIDGSAPHSETALVSNQISGALALSDLPQLGASPRETNTASSAPAPIPTLPSRIVIPAIDLDLDVQNPLTRDIAALDALLKAGPARYVDSSKLGAKGNMLIFAHSSRLPVVHNQMYKAFNRISELTEGNIITLRGQDGKDYLYLVTSVKTVDVHDEEAIIYLSEAHGTKLTLVTCDTLTGKSARFVVEADFAGTYSATI